MASGLEQLATYADAQLDHVMKEMLGKLFVEQPDNPVGFMIKFLKDYDNDSLLQASRDDCEPAQQEGEMPTMQVERPGGNASGGRRRVGVSAEPVNMQKLADQKHRIIPKSDQDREHIRTAVKNNFLFSSLDDEQMSIVLDAMAEKKYKKGDYVIKQGDPDGNEFYVLGEGSCECYLVIGDDPPKMVKNYEKGEAFGELSLMYNTPRAASIMAATDALLWEMDRATFQKVLLFTTAKKREDYEKFLANVEILDSLDKYERGTVADALIQKKYEAGDYILKQGDTEDTNFYILMEGTLTATKKLADDEDDEQDDEPEVVFTYKTPGQYFGELALLNHNPREADVIATTPCTIVYLDCASFTRLLGPAHDIMKRNKEIYDVADKLAVVRRKSIKLETKDNPPKVE